MTHHARPIAVSSVSIGTTSTAPTSTAPTSTAPTSLFLFSELSHTLPEFAGRHSETEDDGNDDPHLVTVLMALADFVSGRLATMGTATSELRRALAIVESLVELVGDDEIALELIGAAFFDDFATDRRRQLGEFLGARSRQILERLDGPMPAAGPALEHPGGDDRLVRFA